MADKDEKETRVKNLFSDLIRFEQSEQYNKALKVCNKILNEEPHNKKAFHCRIVCLIQESKFEEALERIGKNDKLTSEIGGLVFERAYCYYRLNKPNEAMNLLLSTEDPSDRERELLAQIQYKLEMFNDSYKIYKDLVKNSQDEFEAERLTNLTAAIAACQFSGQDHPISDFDGGTYETVFNQACHLAACEKYEDAIEKLKEAEELCQQAFEDDPDEIENEVAAIRVQHAYALQKLGKVDEALQTYNQIIKQKPDDMQVMAVAANNIICINKDQNVFDSKKKLKIVTSDAPQQKLTTAQKKHVNTNQCLLMLHTNQLENCKKQAIALSESRSDSDVPLLIHASALLKEKQPNKAVELLKTKAEKDGSRKIKMALAQVLLLTKDINSACKVLGDMDIAQKPGIISALVSLYVAIKDVNSASSVLDKAIEHYKKIDPNGAFLNELITTSANFNMQHDSPQKAASQLEFVRKQNPRNQQILAQLIVAYAKYDHEKAKKLTLELPIDDGKGNDIDVKELEAAVGTFGNKYIKRVTSKTDQSPRIGSASKSGDALIEKKKKKKRKTKLPKGVDNPGNPDPERWLPMRERSYFRGRRRNKKKEIGKGSQGVSAAQVTAAGVQLDASKTASDAKSSPVSQPPPQAKPTSYKAGTGRQQKKKKKGR
ncbi:DgyrCDS4849 [Dimorphilus gyrociliatus]|uniref:Signal recognition particle subunit SRP72 n=1 Tax=Dimorphilus gyrociliatus TaxID=2664684 RepID=A0A7I8VKU5_9ANNE|nr:DgyrCDS4849 [Dimorphilus gyrociliatus]